jgi:PAS domain S-box-containing protein
MIGKKALSEFFKISPMPSLVLLPDAPRFTIADVNEAFLEATQSTIDDLIGKGIFDAFPDNDSDPTANAVANFTKSLNTVIKTGKKHQMPVQKYEIPIRGTSEFELKYWESENIPLFDDNGKLNLIVHSSRDITEHKIAVNELKKLNKELVQRVKERTQEVEKVLNRFEYATKATSDAIWDWDFENNRVYRAEGFKTIFGFDMEELNLPNTKWENYIHPDDKHSATKSIHDMIHSSENYWKHDYRILKPNGEVAFVQDRAYIIREENNSVTRIIGAIKDITKQRQEDERLQLLESVVTNTNDAIVILEALPSEESGRKIVYVNESFTRMSGYSSDEIIGKTHQLLHGPNTDATELAQMNKALDAWKACEVTITNYTKSGKQYWVNQTLNPVSNEKGEYTHWISIERDITSRIKQEKELYITTLRLFDTLESIQDGFYTLDNNWNITYWNREAEKISDTISDYMIGKNFWEFFEGRISQKINEAFRKAKSSNTPNRTEVYSKIDSNWYELNAFPSEIGLSVYFKNITERKIAESKLKKMYRELENHIKELAFSNQELEQFAYVASHDLQEPLRMITSFLSLIEKKYNDVLDEKGKQYIFFAVDGAKRMRQIILDLLEFSRVSKNESKLQVVNLNSVIEDITLLYRKEIKDKKAIIQFEGLPKIKTYATPIKQVFQNLISNSLKYSKADRPPIITITFRENHTSWKFEIKDNGIGIDREYFDKIFIIFQRLHNKDEYTGTGMGLAITKKIIENLKGKISLTSEVNQGTTFYLSIPKK